MILVDTNLLIYAAISDFPQHPAARDWLDSKLNGPAPVGIPWPCLLGFVRITSNPRVFKRPQAVSRAWRQVESWMDCEPVWVPQPTDRHREILTALIPFAASANLVPDAHLAALAIEHGLTLCSTDTDFVRFPELNLDNPLA